MRCWLKVYTQASDSGGEEDADEDGADDAETAMTKDKLIKVVRTAL
jgi:hypothetical protein